LVALPGCTHTEINPLIRKERALGILCFGGGRGKTTVTCCHVLKVPEKEEIN
jgi:hypothetical protein